MITQAFIHCINMIPLFTRHILCLQHVESRSSSCHASFRFQYCHLLHCDLASLLNKFHFKVVFFNCLIIQNGQNHRVFVSDLCYSIIYWAQYWTMIQKINSFLASSLATHLFSFSLSQIL